MFGLTPAHLVIILVIALVVIGPGKLPEVGGAIGKSIREFQKAAGQITEPTQAPQAPQPAQQMQPAQPMAPAQSYYAAQPVYGAPQPPQYGAPVYPQQQSPQYGVPAYPVAPQYGAPAYPMNPFQPLPMDSMAAIPMAPQPAPMSPELPLAGPRVD
jgi:sec-independent protein translocase protein TatA